MDVVLCTRLQGKKIFVLTDVAGAEQWVLEGAGKMFACEPKPIWMVEIMVKEHQSDGVEINLFFKNIFQLFLKNGYQTFNIDGNMSPITMEQVYLILKRSLESVTHNYIFLESNAVL